jgi:exonuclease SbcC
MIPVKLHVHNFLCYRQVPPLDFRDLHLTCLAGDNGSGKSALLDAMTWALWGKARARRDDELIHHGQTEMEVEFEFLLGDGRYRVIRKRDSRKSGRSGLELHGWDDAQGRFRPLTEPTMRATQARINDLLRMDYDTFVNSAFLLQGRADEFTIKPPGERKRILGEILSLNLFDELEVRAKDHGRECKEENERITARIAEIDKELDLRSTFEADLANAQTDVDRLANQSRRAEAERDALRAQQRTLEVQKDQLTDLETRLRQGEQELAEIEGQVAQHQAWLAEDEALIERREEIERGAADYDHARQSADEMSAKAAQLVALRERHEELASVVADARRVLESERDAAARQVEDLAAQAEQNPALRADLKVVQGQLAHLKKRDAQQQTWREEQEQLASEIATLEAHNQQYKADMQPLKERLDALEAAEAVCPLCQQPLSDGHRERVAAEFKRRGKEMGDAYRANVARMQDLLAQREALAQEVNVVADELGARVELQRREGVLSRSLADAEAAAADLAEQQARLATLERELETGDYAKDEQTALQEVLAQLESLGYDAQAHEAAQDRLTSLAGFEAEKARLEAALTRREQTLTALDDLRARRERWQATLATDQEKQKQLAVEVEALSGVERQLAVAQADLDEVQLQERRARDRVAAARQKLDHCDYLGRQREDMLAAQKEAAEEQAVYEELRLAFGKQGVQALIIESAIPDIEDEANHLLARMTDGRMSVHFETQRQTLKGEARETLDIHISDEQGTRSYDLYSGGEKFRVNFAIRIALSKLLAHRAGASLQTLVVDEGFGSQDAEGRTRLVEAINAVKEDFARILVVTHIEELKDTFPMRIDVWKTPEGSQFAVNWAD